MNRVTRRLRAAAGVLLVWSSVFASPVAYGALPAPVSQALAAAGIGEASVGLYVHEAGARQPLITHRAERPLSPASTMKLVTTYAALDLLGPAFAWDTEIYATGPVQNGALSGDLVIKGSGDPKLTQEALWLVLRTRRAAR